MPIAREQLSTAMLDHGECAETVIFQLEDPRGIIKGSGPLQERHWNNLHGNVNRIPGRMSLGRGGFAYQASDPA
jgi:hypothetical protein